MDERFPDSETHISNKSWGSIEVEDLERCKISKIAFDKAMEEALRRIASSAHMQI